MINILAQNVDFIISGTVCNNLAVYYYDSSLAIKSYTSIIKRRL